MSRSALLGAAACVAAALAMPAAARADMPTIDMTSVVQLKALFDSARQQYQEAQQIFATLSHPLQALGIAPEMFEPQVRNMLPPTGQLSGMIFGNGGPNPLSGLMNQILQQNKVYTPQGGDFTANWINQGAASNAGVQALWQNLVAAMQQRMTGLDDLEKTCLGNAADVTAVDGCTARLTAEQNFASTQLGEAQALQGLAAAQQQARDQQLDQQARRDADELVQQTSPLAEVAPCGVCS